MPTKVFVGRLAEGTSSEDILGLFRKFGTVTECDVISNYGFVHMSSEDEAKAAIAALDGYSVKGSHIHVELSTASTQGRKRRSDDSFRDNGRQAGDRFDPYPPRRDGVTDSGYRAPASSGSSADRGHSREEFASDQVKDLLELYFRDPVAFDQYAKTYYYGERMERARAVYYDRRPLESSVYPPPVSRREDDLLRAGAVSYPRTGYPYPAGAVSVDVTYSRSSTSLRDERGRVPQPPGSYGGRL